MKRREAAMYIQIFVTFLLQEKKEKDEKNMTPLVSIPILCTATLK